MAARLLPAAARAVLASVRDDAIERAVRHSAARVGFAVIYHGIAERTGDPKRELVPPHGKELFDAELRHLKEHYSVVPASDLPAAVARRRRGEPVPVSITFDDDLRSHVDYAVPALLEHGLPAAFFLNGGSLRESHVYWWDGLQRAVDERRPEVEQLFGTALATGPIQSLGEHIESLTPADRTAVAHKLADIAREDRLDAGLGDSDVKALHGAGFEIGFHTLRHDPLPPLEDEALAAALTEGRRHLAQLVDADVQLLAYPHGQADARVAEAARAAGYEIAFTTDEERISESSNSLLLGRFTPSFVSPRHFASQISKTLLGRLARRGSRAAGGR